MESRKLYIPLCYWFQQPLVWHRYEEKCYKRMVQLYINCIYDNYSRWTKENFYQAAENFMCTEWSKDFNNNEFWKSEESKLENASQLSREKALNDLYNLPYSDELILFAMSTLRYTRQVTLFNEKDGNIYKKCC